MIWEHVRLPSRPEEGALEESVKLVTNKVVSLVPLRARHGVVAELIGLPFTTNGARSGCWSDREPKSKFDEGNEPRRG